MEPIRLNRAPWEATATDDARGWRVDPNEQLRRDEERKRILEQEAKDYEARGDRVGADAVRREIARTRGGEATATGDTSNPFRAPATPAETSGPIRLDRAPWEAARRPTSAYYIDFDEPAQAESSPGFGTRIKDLLVKGISSVPRAGESAAGLVGLVPGLQEPADAAGKWAGDIAKQIDQAWLSAYQLGKEKELQDRLAKYDNFVDQAKEAAAFLYENPGQVLTTVAGSTGEILAGGAYGRAIKAGTGTLGLGLRTGTSAAAGEGLAIAGGVSNQIGQGGGDYGDRLLYSGLAGLAGFGTGRLGGALMGESDIDTAIARRVFGATDVAADTAGTVTRTPLPNVFARVSKGALSEGILEEAPQSFFEQGFTNLGTDRPFLENTGGATVIGAAAGSAMGGTMGLRRPDNTFTREEAIQAMTVMRDTTAPMEERLAAAEYLRSVQNYTKGEDFSERRYASNINSMLFRDSMERGESVDLLTGAPAPSAAAGAPSTNTAGQQQDFFAALRDRSNQRAEDGPNQPAVWQLPVSTGLGETQRGLYAQGPTAINAATNAQTPMPANAAGLTPAQIAAAGGTPPLGPSQQAALRGPQGESTPRPATGTLTETQAMAAAGPAALTSATRPAKQTSPASGSAAASPRAAPAGTGAFSSEVPATAAAKKTVVKKAAAARKKASDDLADELEVANEAADAALAKSIASAVNREDLGAQVQGDKRIKFAGRMSLTEQELRSVRKALLSKNGKTGDERTQRIADATRAFIDAYDAYLDTSTNAAKSASSIRKLIGKPQASANARSAKYSEELRGLAKDVSNALYALGQATNNNAKDIEAIVRFVKDSVQKKLIKPGRALPKTVDAMKSVDSVLSSAWTAAKRGTFMGEDVDTADVSGQLVRQSEEQQEEGNLASALEKYAKEGYKSPKGGKELKYGIQGVLQYLSFNTTPMGKALSVALQDALDQSENAPRISFVDKSGSRYDPKTNTIYINRNEQSAEVVLHETLHAALQWFVYQNPNHPAVKSLQGSLERALAAKDLTGKAKDVQDVLAKLVKQKRGLDAVLELVSYNATLNEFRKAMQALPSSGQTGLFKSSLNTVWNAFKRLISVLTGKPSLSSDILDATMQLLEDSTKEQAPKKGEGAGKVLAAEVQSEQPSPVAEEVSTATNTRRATGMTARDYRTYTRRVAPKMLSTKFLFDLVGWDKNVAAKVSANASKLADRIRKNHPTLERVAILFDSMFSAGDYFRELNKEFKVNKNVGYQQMERLAKFVETRPDREVLALMNYMDGDKNALRGVPGKDMLSRMADNITEWFKAYIEALPDNEKRFFKARKFSESLLYATRTEQVARGTLGANKLASVIGLRHKVEETLDPFFEAGWMKPDKDGMLDLDQKFYEVLRVDPQTNKPVHEGFMSVSEYNRRDAAGESQPKGVMVDTKHEWWVSPQDVGAKKIKFSTSMTARQAVEQKQAKQLADAMRNTAAALATNYASKVLFDNMAAYGYEGDKPTALSIAFNSLEDLKEATGKQIPADRVLNAGAGMASSPYMIAKYRRSGTYVQLPDEATYGALRGKIIEGPVWTAMLDMSDRQPLIQNRAYNDIMRWFKKSKTVFNPGTHITNIASNVTLAMMHDIPVTSMGAAARTFTLFETNPDKLKKHELDMMQAFMNSGAMLGDFSSSEVKQALLDAWSDNMSSGNEVSIVKRLTAWANYEKTKSQKLAKLAMRSAEWADRVATESYAAEDNIFRLAAFLTKVGDLQNERGARVASEDMYRTAGDFARNAFLDYDIDSKAVRVMRQSFLPFISWSYAIAPVLGRMALHQPWKIANVLMTYYIMESALAALAGGDDDEERKKGPEYLRERMFGNLGPHMYVRMPWGDSANPVYYKLGDYIPFASMAKAAPLGPAGQSWVPSFLTPSGPLISGVLGIIAGVDPYSGKSIHQPTDTDWDKLYNTYRFTRDVVLPPALSTRNADKISDILNEVKGPTGKEPSSLVFARMLGLKLYDYDEDEAAVQQSKMLKGVQKDFKAAMTRAKKKEIAKGSPDYEALDEELNELRDRMLERMSEIRGDEYDNLEDL